MMWKLRKRPWYAHIFSEKRDFGYVTTTYPLSSKWAEHFLSIKMCTKLSFFDHFFVFAPEISFIQRFWPYFCFFLSDLLHFQSQSFQLSPSKRFIASSCKKICFTISLINVPTVGWNQRGIDLHEKLLFY